MANFAHGLSGAHPFYKVLRELVDEPADRFSLSAAARLAEEFAFLGLRQKVSPAAKKERRTRQGDYAEFAQPDTVAEAAGPETTVEAVRRDLRIKPRHGIEDLRRIRKRFAAGNHPDRSPSAVRAACEQRMKIANAIIDEEIARRRSAAGAR